MRTGVGGVAGRAWGSVVPVRNGEPAGALEPHGPVAAAIAELWWLMLALSGVVFAVFLVVLVAALVRRPRDDNEGRPAGNPRSSILWIAAGGVAMPVVVILLVLALTVATMDTVSRAAPDPLVIDVTGHQWWWEVEYPELGVTTSNEIHLPVGRPVEVRLRSADVIHSFWVPALAGKKDALPEDINILLLEADQAGSLHGSCAEFCGLQHAKMDLLVVAEPPEEFEAWVAGQVLPAATGPSAETGTAAALFDRAGCSDCHTIRGTGADGTAGPDLTHLASRRTLGGGTIPNDRANLTAWIRNPHDAKPGVLMPASELDDQDVAALVEYLEGLR